MIIKALLFLFDVVCRMAIGIEISEDDIRKLSDPSWYFDLKENNEYDKENA